MDKKFELSLKDIVYLVSLVVALLGGWYSLQTRVQEYELKAEADKQILELKLQSMQAQIDKLSSEITAQHTSPPTKKGKR